MNDKDTYRGSWQAYPYNQNGPEAWGIRESSMYRSPCGALVEGRSATTWGRS
jgi:hypothetical protein